VSIEDQQMISAVEHSLSYSKAIRGRLFKLSSLVSENDFKENFFGIIQCAFVIEGQRTGHCIPLTSHATPFPLVTAWLLHSKFNPHLIIFIITA
jgi:hypothetical protein